MDYLNAPLTVSAGEAVVLAVAEPRTHETRHMVIPRVALIGIGPTVRIGIYSIVTSQYSSSTLYQVSYHIK